MCQNQPVGQFQRGRCAVEHRILPTSHHHQDHQGRRQRRGAAYQRRHSREHRRRAKGHRARAALVGPPTTVRGCCPACR